MLRKLIFSTVTLMFLFFASLLIGEAVLRTYQYQRYGAGTLSGKHGFYVEDAKLGWRMRENIRFDITEKDALKEESAVHFQTFSSGFRSFGDTRSSRKKLFFIGDSYTASTSVSGNKTYFGRIKSVVEDAEIFAYGGPGYGNLQEYLILDEFIDVIKPNVVIIQFCWNDFLDNNYNLDPLRSIYNSGFRRPYLEPSGDIVHKYATYGGFFISLPEVISNNLRILAFINQKIGQIYSRLGMFNLEDIEIHGIGNSEFKKSVETTRSILQMVKVRARNTPVFLFCIPYRQPYYDEIRNICRSTGIGFIDGPGKNLREREKEAPLSTKAADHEHLNEEGHRVIFENLMLFFTERGILRRVPF